MPSHRINIGLFSTLLIAGSGVAETTAPEPKNLSEKVLRGLELRLQSQRSMASRTHSSERHAWQKRAEQTLKHLQAQKSVLNISDSEAPSHEQVALDLSPATESPRPKWLPLRPQAPIDHLHLEEIPKDSHWVPDWGLSHRKRRENKPHSPGFTPQAWAANANGEKTKSHSKQSPRRTAPPEFPLEETRDPTAVLPKVAQKTLATDSLSLAVPYPHKRGAWWLWHDEGLGYWTKIRAGWADQNISMDDLKQGRHRFVFTKEERRPNREAEHYLFILDTQPPEVKLFEKNLTERGELKLSWACQDPPHNDLSAQLSIFGPQNTVLVSLGQVGSTASYVLLKEHQKHATAARLRIQDKAGNKEQAWIKF